MANYWRTKNGTLIDMRIVLVCGVFVLGLVLAVATYFSIIRPGMQTPSDPRAYPGSDPGRTLDEILKYNYLKLPKCSRKTVRYYDSSSNALNPVLYLRWSGGKSCVKEFLAVNKIDAMKLTTRDDGGEGFEEGPPFVVNVANGLGWFKGDGRTFDTYEQYLPSPDVPDSSDVRIGISWRKTGADVYIRAINNRT